MSLQLRTTLSAVVLGVLCLSLSESAHAEDRGLVLESYVGARPRDADYLLAPLLDELKRIGFDGPTTLEVFGEDAVKTSADRLRQWFA